MRIIGIRRGGGDSGGDGFGRRGDTLVEDDSQVSLI